MAELNEEFISSMVDAAKTNRSSTLVRTKDTRIKKASRTVFGGALKILDYIERPYNALMNFGLDAIGGPEGFHPIRSFREGLTGETRTTFSDVTTEAGWKPTTTFGKFTKGVTDFVGGVLFDPVTYVTGGFGKGAMILGRGTKPLNGAGRKLFEGLAAKELGVRAGSKGFNKAIRGMDNDSYIRVIKNTLDIAEKNPQKYFAIRNLRFAGKTIANLDGISSTVSKALSPILKIPLGKRAFKVGNRAFETLGDAFIPHYGIRKNKNLNLGQKYELIAKADAHRVGREIAQSARIEGSLKFFKGFNKKERSQVTFELEKFLKLKSGFDNSVAKVFDDANIIAKSPNKLSAISGTPDELISQGKMAEALALSIDFQKKSGNKDAKKMVVNKINRELSKQVDKLADSAIQLNKIRDPKIRGAVKQLQEDLKAVVNKEVKDGLRDADAVVNEGYVKRIAKGFKEPSPVTTGSLRGRKQAIPTIEESIQAYKKGDQDWRFEDDVAKWLSARMTESDNLFFRKDLNNWLESNNYIRKLRKSDDVLELKKQGWEVLNYRGKKFVALKDIAEEFNILNKNTDFTAMKQFLNMYDEVLNTWKLTVTSLWPSFHARNAQSNVFLGWLGGNKNAKTYTLAGEVQLYGKRLRAGKKPVDKSIGVDGETFKLSEIYNMAVEDGVLGSGWFGGDFLNKVRSGPTGWGERVNPKMMIENINYYTGKLRKGGTAVENNARVALYVDQLVKGKTRQEAAVHTKKFLFDYSELTKFEKDLMKRVIPFYTWMRKNMPLQIEQMAKQPGKYTGFLHFKEGIEDFSPEIEEKYMPEWMQDSEIFVDMPGNKVWNPDLPFQDLASMFDIKKYVSATSPLIKGFFEIATNKNFFTGRPIADERLPKSKFKRELYKNWFMDQMRVTSFWRKAQKEDKSTFEFYLDFIFGLKSYDVDKRLGRQNYIKKIKGQRAAEKSFDKKVKDNRNKNIDAVKKLFGK